VGRHRFVKSCAQDVAGTGITVNRCAGCVETEMIYNPATFKLFCPEIENPLRRTSRPA